MNTLFDRHQRIVLQFSGGKDSLATLAWCRPYWDRLIVLWLNTGAALPETIQQMAAIRTLVPHFREVRSNQPAQLERHGYPADLLPSSHTELGCLADGVRHPLLQPYFQCCHDNLWLPLHQATFDLGATLIIRGQRQEETKKAPLRSGDVIDGIEYFFPLEDWSGAQVRAYLAQQEIALPPHYAAFDSSLDCWSCTAYLGENIGKLGYLEQAHPALGAELRRRITLIRDAARHEQRQLEQFLEDEHV